MRHLSTGCNAVSPRQNSHRADKVGLIRVATRNALELRLRAAVVRRDVAAVRTRAAGVVRRHRQQPLHASLYSSWRWNSAQPWSRIDVFKPLLARTFRPGRSAAPAKRRIWRCCWPFGGSSNLNA